MGMLKTYQEQLQDMVNKGIDAAEKQQNRLASKPFDMAEKLEESARARSVKSLRKTYYGYSENVFDQLRELNVKMGEFTAQLLSRVEKEVSEGADTVVEGAMKVAATAEDVEVAFESAESELKAEDVEAVKAKDVKPAKASTAKTEENVSA